MEIGFVVSFLPGKLLRAFSLGTKSSDVDLLIPGVELYMLWLIMRRDDRLLAYMSQPERSFFAHPPPPFLGLGCRPLDRLQPLESESEIDTSLPT